MSIVQPTRRGLITGLAALIAAPALVKASSLMPVKAWVEPLGYDGLHFWSITWIGTNDINGNMPEIAGHMEVFYQRLAETAGSRSVRIMQPFMRVGPNDTVHVQADISLTPLPPFTRIKRTS